jgi:hypothetical protein
MNNKELIRKVIKEDHITRYEDFLQTPEAEEYALTPTEIEYYTSKSENTI